MYCPQGSCLRPVIAEIKSRAQYFSFVSLFYNIFFTFFVINIEFISMSVGSGGSPEQVQSWVNVGCWHGCDNVKDLNLRPTGKWQSLHPGWGSEGWQSLAMVCVQMLIVCAESVHHSFLPWISMSWRLLCYRICSYQGQLNLPPCSLVYNSSASLCVRMQ